MKKTLLFLLLTLLSCTTLCAYTAKIDGIYYNFSEDNAVVTYLYYDSSNINKWECTLLVPDGSLTLYQAADQWKEFFFMDIEPDGIKNLKQSKDLKDLREELYDLSGLRLNKPQRGINIIRYSDGTTIKVKK